jgi:UDP-2,4-diacetamido-2,4,6-trideoxy-beta-L-altropyranose hydrolase
MRCLALAQAWQDAGGSVVFAMAESTPAIDQRLRSEGMKVARLQVSPNSVQDARVVSALARHYQATWIVVDGYRFDSEYQRNLKNAGLRVLFVDDLGQCEHYSADLVLNQNVHASECMYASCEPYTRFLFGPRFAMLRRDFKSWSQWQRETTPSGRKVLVTMGGSDPDNVTAVVLEALGAVKIDGLEVVAVLGGSNPHIGSLERFASQSPPIRLLRDAANMPELMAWADIAVSAAGSTCGEMCLLGLPAILIDLAENQRPVAQELSRKEAAIYLGSSGEVTATEIGGKVQSLLLSPEQRLSLSRRSRELVDGEGAERVKASIRGEDLRLRRVQAQDCRQLWKWANDPAVRPVSFATEPISWERHLLWFNSKLRDPNAVLYLVVDSEDVPAGQVRYQIDNTTAAVSISLSPQFRGKGYGEIVLKMATEDLFRTTAVARIDAYVKPNNTASLRLFTRAGYARQRTGMISGHQAIHFVLDKVEEVVGHQSHRAEVNPNINSLLPDAQTRELRKIAICQPTYLPWLGYFDLIDQVDVFVLLNSVQFQRQSWQHRNRLKTPSGLRWLTVPVMFRGRFGQLINKVQIRDGEFWRHHLRAIELNYRRAPFFDRYFGDLSSQIKTRSSSPALMAELDIHLIEWFMNVLGIRTKVLLSSDLEHPGKRIELLANICTSLGGKQYVSPLGSAAYLLQGIDVMSDKGIDVVFQHYEHPTYRQLFPPFCPYASVLDLIFNEGERALDILRSGRRVPFLPAEVGALVSEKVAS